MKYLREITQRFHDVLEDENISKNEYGNQPCIHLTVPLFIRMLEYAKEDAKTDIDLHNAAERILKMQEQESPLGMDDYEAITTGHFNDEEKEEHQVKEDQFDEVSKDTLYGYINKAETDKQKHITKAREDRINASSHIKNFDKRSQGIARAKNRYAGAYGHKKNNGEYTVSSYGPKMNRDERKEAYKKVYGENQLLESLRHIETHEEGKNKAVVYRDNSWNEYRVKYHKDGKYLPDGDSHHDDEQDAHDSAKWQLNQWKTKNEAEQIDEISKETLKNYVKKNYEQQDKALEVRTPDTDKIVKKRHEGAYEALRKISKLEEDITPMQLHNVSVIVSTPGVGKAKITGLVAANSKQNALALAKNYHKDKETKVHSVKYLGKADKMGRLSGFRTKDVEILEAEENNSKKLVGYRVKSRNTGTYLNKGKLYPPTTQGLKAARRLVDKKDNEYGGYAHHTEPVYEGKQVYDFSDWDNDEEIFKHIFNNESYNDGDILFLSNNRVGIKVNNWPTLVFGESDYFPTINKEYSWEEIYEGKYKDLYNLASELHESIDEGTSMTLTGRSPRLQSGVRQRRLRQGGLTRMTNVPPPSRQRGSSRNKMTMSNASGVQK